MHLSQLCPWNSSFFDLLLLISFAHSFTSDKVLAVCSDRTDNENGTGTLDCSRRGIVLSNNVSYPVSYSCSVYHCNETFRVTTETVNVHVTSHYNKSVLDGSSLPACRHSLLTDKYVVTLVRFDGSNNNITDVPCFDSQSKLEWIDLSNNQIKTLLQPLYLGNLTCLVTLILSGNFLHEIHPEAFVHLSSIQYLHLNDNPGIKDWSFLNDFATNLKLLDVRGSFEVGASSDHLFSQCKINTTILINENETCAYNFSHCGCLVSYSEDVPIPGDMSCYQNTILVTEGSIVDTTKSQDDTVASTTELLSLDVTDATSLYEFDCSNHNSRDSKAGLIIIILISFLGVIIYTFTAIFVLLLWPGLSYD